MSKATVTKAILLLSIPVIAALAFAGFKMLGARQAGDIQIDTEGGPAFRGPGESELQVTVGPPDFSISKAQAGPPVHPASFDKDLRSLPQTGPAEKRPIPEVESPFRVRSAPSNAPDAVVQTSAGALSMPAPDTSFKGLDLQNWGAGWPPDINGDAGPTYYIQTVNTSIGVFNKSGTRLAAFTFNTFFTGTGTPCDSSNQGDPVVLYDAQSGRWIITDFAWSDFVNGPYYECIAVSKSADPLSGGWWMYGLRADDASHPYLSDYPKLGVWPDGIYMSANMFDILNSLGAASYNGVRLWALNRDELINGAPLHSVIFDLGSSYYSLLPSNYRGAQPPAGTPAYFASLSISSTHMQLWKFQVDWATPGNSTLNGPTNIPIASYNQPSGQVPQLGSSETLDTLGDRLMMQLQYRYLNGVGSLWATHSVASGGVTGIRWYEIRNLDATPSVYQQSTYQPDSLYRWMGSLAVDGQGNMALGYSVASSSTYPGIRYAGRLAGDPLSTLGQGETSLIAGSGSQSGGYNRWGDYSAMTIDPADDCTFWYTNEYYEAIGNNWQTRIGSFVYPGCPALPPGAFNKAAPGDGSVGLAANPTLSWGASSGASDYEYCYDTSNDNACSAWTSSGTNTSAALSSLSPSTTYYWQVRATNSFTNTYADGSNTSFWSFTTGEVPGAFGKAAPGDGAIDVPTSPTLSWGASSGASGYEYCYDTSNDNACSAWTSSSANTSVALSGLSSNTTYYWQVRANNSFSSTYADGGDTAFWSFTTANVPDQFSKSAPSDGAIDVPTSPTLSWGASSGATGYEYCYDTSNDSTCSTWTSSATNTSVALSGLSLNTTYYWQVRANNNFGTTYANVSPTAFWSFTTGDVPGAFGKSTPGDGATGLATNPTLSWGASGGATDYEYCYDTSNDNACSPWTTNGTNTSLALSGLSPNTTYYWQVRANNSFGSTYANGSETAFWSFTTKPDPVVSLAISPGSASVTVGREFDLLVEVQAGAQPVDSVSAYLNFDPAFLQVTSITPGASLPSILVNSYDNTAGQVNFSAGTSANFPSGTFTLVTVTFKALAPTASTSLAFNTSATRVSDASFVGVSVLKDVANGTVTIAISNKQFLPLLLK